MQPRAEVKYLTDIKNLYALYTAGDNVFENVTLGDNVVEKMELKIQLLKTCLFETNRCQFCIVNQLTVSMRF